MIEVEAFANTPIPAIETPTDWKSVVIKECREPLMRLSTLRDVRILINSKFCQGDIPEHLYARESVAQRLVSAASQLSAGYYLFITDAWRPFSTQQAFFEKQCQILREQFPTLSEDEIYRRAEIYISVPSRHPLCPSPHYTGGAIDLTLADSDGQCLPMRPKSAPCYSPVSHTRALEELLENSGHLTEEEEMCLYNRRILYHTMINNGFTNYCKEYWHFDYGDQFWGSITSSTAFYGGIEP
jgi:D-alanyl-D-alanine dipeptidase